jgi:hypothetical protein
METGQPEGIAPDGKTEQQRVNGRRQQECRVQARGAALEDESGPPVDKPWRGRELKHAPALSRC